jgi:hypothetical protein
MEVIDPPRPEDYGFGCFVRLEANQADGNGGAGWGYGAPDLREHNRQGYQRNNRHCTVGIIYNSQLFNPMFLNTGPRLSSDPDPLFTPDLINETRTLLGVVLIGELLHQGTGTYGHQGIPRAVVPVNTPVYRMDNQEIYQFHLNGDQRPQFRYHSLLLRYGGSFATHLTEQVLQELVNLSLFQNADQRALEILCREITWRNTMGAIG